MNERVVVIGSNSFSGSHFVDFALDKGLEVVGISRSDELHPVFLPYKWKEKYSTFNFIKLDLNHDLPGIMTRISEFKPEYVVNFAAQSMVGQSWQYPEHWYRTNVVATVMFHDELRKLDFLQKYVHVSTPEVYGNCKGLIEENIDYKPSTPYAVSRAAADMSLMSFFDAYNFPVVFTRAANVYGPGQQLYRIIPRSILYFLIGKKLQLHGGGQSVRSFIHIRDVVDATLKATRVAEPGNIFHVSTKRNISVGSLVRLIADRMNVVFEENVEVVGDRLGKDSAYLLDSSKAKKTLGWQDQISLEKGIDETISWIENNLDVLKEQPFDYVHKP